MYDLYRRGRIAGPCMCHVARWNVRCNCESDSALWPVHGVRLRVDARRPACLWRGALLASLLEALQVLQVPFGSGSRPSRVSRGGGRVVPSSERREKLANNITARVRSVQSGRVAPAPGRRRRGVARIFRVKSQKCGRAVPRPVRGGSL